MISNLSIAIKINKSKQRPSCSALVEYSTPEEAEKASNTTIVAEGVELDVELVKFVPKDKTDLKDKSQAYRSKVYIGNLPEEFTEELLKESLTDEIKPKVTFLSKTKGQQKKYAFLEFTSETDRNVALGALERIKKGGAFGDDAIVSPAYPYAQKPKNHRRSKQKGGSTFLPAESQ